MHTNTHIHTNVGMYAYMETCIPALLPVESASLTRSSIACVYLIGTTTVRCRREGRPNRDAAPPEGRGRQEPQGRTMGTIQHTYIQP